jgi:hypothetical protein
MSQPAVTITELDGALGVLPAGQKLHAAVGVASSGPLDTPAAFARSKDIISTFGAGPLVEYGCGYVEKYSKPILLVRTGQTVVGIEGTLVTSVAGTSVVTLDTTDPNDDYELYFKVIAGGTIGVAGITFQWSLDGGRTLSPVTALGTANTFAFPGSGGVNLDFAAGTLLAGDFVTARTTAPNWNSTELGTALDALKNTTIVWRDVHIVGIIDATAFDLIETKMASLSSSGKPKAWTGNTRKPNIAESEATYAAAMDTIFAAKATTYGQICSGACELTSSVSGRKYLRPVSYAIAALGGSVSEEIDIADVNLGALVGVSIRDVNGNPKHHDESINPGLDDMRFTVLRTWDEVQGVYVNRPRVFSAAGSDFQLVPHRLVMNLGRGALRAYFVRRLNRPILVNKTTGFILEKEALEIEAGAHEAMRAVLMAKPKASGGGFEKGRFVKLSRTDNLLSTKTLTGQARIIPLAYVEFLLWDIGFYNPALQVVAV